jgi:tetratricopeptide (TPR) repeat protein
LAGGAVSSADEFFKDAWYYREQAEEAKDRAVDARAKLDKAAERKAIDEQIAALGEYVKQSPSDTDLLEDYAMLLAGNLRDADAIELACSSFEKVAEQDPERVEARKKLAALLILPTVHRYNDAAAQLEAVLKQTPNDSEALVLLGRCQIAMSRSEKAVATLEQAIDAAPHEVDAYYFLAIAQRFRLNRPAEADAWIDKMVAANPQSATAHRYVCNYLLSLKTDNPNPKLARLHAEEAIRLDPENSELLFFAAQASLATADFDAARKYAEAGLEKEKDSPVFRERMYLILADTEIKTKNVAKAREVLEKAFGDLANPQLLWLAADVQCDQRDLDAAAASIDKLASLNFPAGGLDYLRGRISLMKGDWYEARKALEKAVPAFPDKPDVLKRIACWLGACYGQLGDADRQIAAFRRALEIDPKFEPARKALSEALKRTGKREEAKQILEQLRTSGSSLSNEQLAELARLYLQTGNWKEAKPLLRQLVEANPNDVRHVTAFVGQLLDHEEIAVAETHLKKMEEKWPRHAQTILLQGKLSVRHGKIDDAVELMTKFVDDAQGVPADQSQRTQLVALGMEELAKQLNAANEVIDKEHLLRAAEKLLRRNADLHPSAALDLVNFLARQRRAGEAVELLEKNWNWKGCDPAALATACFNVFEAGRDNEDAVRRTLEILHAARTFFHEQSSLALVLGNVYVSKRDYAQAEQCFRDALAKKPDDAAAMNNLAMVLVMSKKDLSDALELINKAIKIAGPLGQMLDTRACVYIAQGEAQKALDDLEKALADARTAERLFHQAEAFELAAKKDSAAKAMKEALDKGLDVKTLPPGDIPVFERLKKLAEESPSI